MLFRQIGNQRPHLRDITGIVDIIELEIALADPRHLPVVVGELHGVGGLAERDQAEIAPVADRIESPMLQPAADGLEEIRFVILLAVFDLEVAPVEGDLLLLADRESEPLRTPGAADRIAGDGQHIHAVGEEKPPFRIDHPPFSVILGNPEVAGRLQLRAVLPAAEAVPLGRPF